MNKKAEEQRNRYLRVRQVWEGGNVTCLCCNLPSAIVLEGAVLRTLPKKSLLALTREEMAELIHPIWMRAKKNPAKGLLCPRCERRRAKVKEQKLYYVQIDEGLRAGPMCVDCVSETVEEMGADRQRADVPVWIVKCGQAALDLMQHIDFSKVRADAPRAPREVELLY